MRYIHSVIICDAGHIVAGAFNQDLGPVTKGQLVGLANNGDNVQLHILRAGE